MSLPLRNAGEAEVIVEEVLDQIVLFDSLGQQSACADTVSARRHSVLRKAALLCTLKEFQDGETLARQNEAASAAFVLIGGVVSISITNDGNTGNVVRQARAAAPTSNAKPTMLCVWHVLTGEPCRSTITALGPDATRVIVVPKAAFAEALAMPHDLMGACKHLVGGAVQQHGARDRAREEAMVQTLRAAIESHLGLHANGDRRSPRGASQDADTNAGVPVAGETEEDLDLWEPPAVDESEGVDRSGKQFLLNCQSCGRILMRNARVLQQANRYADAAHTAARAARLFRHIVLGDTLKQATMDAPAGLREAETLARRWTLLATNCTELVALAPGARPFASSTLPPEIQALHCEHLRSLRAAPVDGRHAESAHSGSDFRQAQVRSESVQARAGLARAGLWHAQPSVVTWCWTAFRRNACGHPPATCSRTLSVPGPAATLRQMGRVFPSIARVFGAGRQPATMERGQRMQIVAAHVLRLRCEMPRGEDNGARLQWCAALFAEAASVLTMAGGQDGAAEARQQRAVCLGFAAVQQGECLRVQAMATDDPALHEKAIASFEEAARVLEYDEAWGHVLTGEDALLVSRRVLQARWDYGDWWMAKARGWALQVNKDTCVYAGQPALAEEAFTRAMGIYEDARGLAVCGAEDREGLVLARGKAERERGWNRQARVSEELARLDKVPVLSMAAEAAKTSAAKRELARRYRAGGLSADEYKAAKAGAEAALRTQVGREDGGNEC